MRYFARLFAVFLLAPALLAQVQRDPLAIATATQAFNSLGGSVPGDSRATGTYDRVAGSSEDTGTIEILTRSYDQTSEKTTNSGGANQVAYSRGYASQKDQNGVTRYTLEKSLASNSVAFPVLVIAPAVLDPNSTAQFVATESLNGNMANHIRICPSTPDQNFSDIISMGTKDVWVDAASGLPVQIAYQVIDSEGVPAIPVTVSYSNYQLLNGTKYPFQIQESRNGTPYMAVSITSIVFDVGLTDQDFVLQ
jgi:hypothetical protein